MGEYRKERLLLKRQVKLIIDPMEFRMALWINGFGLSDAVTGEEIIPLCHSYNLEHMEEAGNRLEIDSAYIRKDMYITMWRWILLQELLLIKGKYTVRMISEKL